ncbi:hypothetical protein [Chroococcidiopsis sp. CCALA 051]|nr:hypothetical protein [Chroococcidiopsis sp. CCALA 051]
MLLIVNLAQQMKLTSNILYDAPLTLTNQGGTWRCGSTLQVG